MQRARDYDHAEVERRARKRWAEADVFRTPDAAEDPAYVLAMFPYPSGEMHMGHVRNYAITDAYARQRRMQGEAVLHPMGWDAFGLPAENAAIERGVDPREWTMDCIATMKEQMEVMGLGFDWEREVTTCEPDYYRWNQWLFLRFHGAGLVERKAAELNWCPDCETVLADEQVEGEEGRCWRCGTPIERRELDQWFFTITDYADELQEALDDLEGWPGNVREMQRNWIGRQEGAVVEFAVPGRGDVEVFTTRLDTIHGATFLALSPGHGLARELAAGDDEVAGYVDRVERDDVAETSGVFTGEHAVNPATGEEIPVYVADYVLEEVGTGAIYAVPAHDDRDHAFAREHDLEVRQVVRPEEGAADEVDVAASAFTDDGVLVNSGAYDGLESATARERLIEDLDGQRRTEYRLQDWCLSRQRYWGTPIPMVDCGDCGYVPVPDDELPVELPDFVRTTGNPLDAAEDWKETTCPECGGPAERETDTMDTFVDSSWYFLRYVSPGDDGRPFDPERAGDWLPVDQYVGGIEHATMHLIYARFFTKVLADLGLLEGVREPFRNLLTQGMVRKDGEAMSSSTGNVVSPRPFVAEHGADTARLFMLEAAGPETDFDWTEEGARSARRFLETVHGLVADHADGPAARRDADGDVPGGGRDAGDDLAGERDPAADYLAREVAAAAAAATEAFEAFRFNHALGATRELVSLLGRYREHTAPDPEVFERGLATATKLLAPVAPHLAEECWGLLGREGLVAEADWPDAAPPEGYDLERRLVEDTREDVREVLAVAGIDDPREIVLTAAPAWKHRALERARATVEREGADADVVGAVMADDDLRERGEAADYAKALAAEGAGLREALPPEREAAALERAAWLFREEFGADVVVRTAAEADDEARRQARPGRPAIDVLEG